MRKRRIPIIASILMCCVLFAGCWDYNGMGDLTIVAGIAIDLDPDDPGVYAVAFEIVDMDAPTDQGEMTSKLLETKGRTLTEAVYNANQKLHGNMYFGNAEVLVLSSQMTEEVGLDAIIDPLLRDTGIRSNMYVLVSGNETAREIIEPTDIIVSFSLSNNITEEPHSANATKPFEIYQIYDILAEGTSDLALPIVYLSDEETKEISLEGLALFSGSKKVGELDNRHTPYYLLAVSRLNEGSFEISGQSDDSENEKYLAIVDRHSVSSLDYTFDGSRFTFIVKLDMIAAAVEFYGDWGETSEALTLQIEKDAEEMLSQEMRQMILSVQQDYVVDIIGFTDRIYHKEPKLWEQLRDNWPEYLKNADVQVDCSVLIKDTGLIR